MECWDINLFFVVVVFFKRKGYTQQTLFWFEFSEIDCCFFVSDVKFGMSCFFAIKNA